ncbi:MAG: hypothetical protein L0I76_30995 [Pseudonocardia sp.]|nr:hypothetical protein [Pseudonocardia sp.]
MNRWWPVAAGGLAAVGALLGAATATDVLRRAVRVEGERIADAVDANTEAVNEQSRDLYEILHEIGQDTAAVRDAR